jgi:formylglycine-generating enzyme required for sulfatase activity
VSHKYLLPTEAEWEHPCRAGSKTNYYFGDSELELGEYAWYVGNSDVKTHPIARLKPNAWGLDDMHSNVWEWVEDWHGGYPLSSVIDPTGPSSGSSRVGRGGSWAMRSESCRSTIHVRGNPDDRGSNGGLRLTMNP